MSENPVVKLLIKTSAILVMGGVGCALFFTELNEQISSMPGLSQDQTIIEREVLGAMPHISHTVPNARRVC
jgi:hypothetical protein